MKRKIIVVAVVIFAAIGVFSLSQLLKPQETISIASFPLNMDQMIAKSTLVIEGTTVGKSDLKIDDRVTFRLTTVEVNKALKGKSGEKIVILQTKGLPEDPELQNSQNYVLILEPYVQPSSGTFKGTEGAYVLVQAYQGVYKIQQDGAYQPVFDPENKLSSYSKKLTDWKTMNVK